MSTVHQAQRAIQSLLGNSDYVGALDLITTTQEVLKQELQNLVSFRHLDSQLIEIRHAIEKMLRAELERNLSADLNRPVEQMTTYFDKDKLISIIFGHLRMGKVAAIITVLAKEIGTAMTTTCKQTLIEAVSESDSLKNDSQIVGGMANSIHQTIPSLSGELWLKMIGHLGQRLVFLLEHVKEVILLFQNCANVAVGKHAGGDGGDSTSSSSSASNFLPPPDSTEETLISADLYQNFSTELSTQLEKTTETADEKFSGMLRNRKTWMNRNEVLTTMKVVRDFIYSLEEFVNALPPPPSTTTSASTSNNVSSSNSSRHHHLRYTSAIEMKAQVTEYIKDFHQKKVEIVNLSLDREKWRVANEEKVKQNWPVTDIRQLVDIKAQNEQMTNSNANSYQHHMLSRSCSVASNESFDGTNNSAVNGNGVLHGGGGLRGSSDQSAGEGVGPALLTVEVFYVILDCLAEYCHLLTMTGAAEVVLSLVELLRVANARVAHLVLGAGAVELKICKSITVVNLVLVYRGICLLAESLSQVREGVFEKSLQSLQKSQQIVRYNDYSIHV